MAEIINGPLWPARCWGGRDAISNLEMDFALRSWHAELYFYRDSNGNEVDLLYARGGEVLPIEIKSGQTVASD